MKSYWPLLNDKDRDAIRTLVAFLHRRLSEQPIIDWALRTKPHETIKRAAVLQSLEFLDAKQLKDPWRSAWRLIEEGWDQEPPPSSGTVAYRVQPRIVAGERSGSLISAMTATVQPWLKVSARSELSTAAISKRPRRVEEILLASLSSHELAELDIYRLDSIKEIDFLIALGISLEGAVNHGIAIGRRLGWQGDHKFWRLGGLYYAGYRVHDDAERDWEVDKFHDGIAPSVKLLNAVVKRIGALDPDKARPFVSRWRHMSTPVHLRLWASLSQIPELTSAADLSDVLPVLDDRAFWDVHAFPEIAELRALRFNDVSDDARSRILSRMKRGAPRAFWPRDSDRALIKDAQQYWSARELRRIELAGGRLPALTSSWLAVRLDGFPELKNMDSIQFGFPSSGGSGWVEPEPDNHFNDLAGEKRLRALEAALSSVRRSWNDDPAERASDWIQNGENSSLILSDFEATVNGGAEFANTWERFGWSHRAPNGDSKALLKNRRTGNRVLALLELLPAATIELAIEGITYWVSSWERIIARSQRLEVVWTKLWPIAVVATNGITGETDTIDLNQLIVDGPDSEPSDLDTLNTAVGRLVGTFLALCPSNKDGKNPFKKNDLLRAMRDSIIAADGKAGLIGRHRLIEALPYFLTADEEWSKQTLVRSLVTDDAQSLALWRAIARRTRFTDVLKVIGHQFADRAADRRLGRETRGSLLSSLVLESLHAFRDGRDPAVANARVQQTLRSVDDEVRANAAQMVQRFLSSMANNPRIQPRQSAGDVFRLAVAPFLKNVWPQERSLATRGVSAAFADLPAAAGDAFSEAVSAVERFLVPFDCWSMYDFGLGGDVDEVPRLASINTPETADALLLLLGSSIGAAEGSVVPMDLADALDQIRSAGGRIVQDSEFRRLETVARRR
jgi:hypothetical protein